MNTYKIKYQDKGTIYTKVVNEQELLEFQNNHTLISIKTKKSFLPSISKISNNAFLEILNEIELLMKAHITLYDALQILHKSTQKKTMKLLLHSMIHSLEQGQSLVMALQPYEKTLDPIILSFFKIAHKKGNIQEIISALCDILKTKYDNKRLIVSSLSYPLFLFISFIVALIIIFEVVIPKFEYIFIQYNLSLPLHTTILLQLKEFLQNYGWLLMIIVLVLYLLIRLSKWQYLKEKWLIQYLPIIGRVYKYYELHNFFVGLRVLTNCHYELNVALQNSQFLLKNQYLLDKIQNLQQHIHNGMSLHEAFLKVDLFDELVLNVIHSAQMSSKLSHALGKIEIYYKNRFITMIKRLSSVIEPLFFIVMMLLILWVMLAIFTPIWNMSEMINL